MDTLSRKHRLLKQQQQQVKNHHLQTAITNNSNNKENRQYNLLENYRFDYSTLSRTSSSIDSTNHFAGNNDEEEEFRVFKVVQAPQNGLITKEASSVKRNRYDDKSKDKEESFPPSFNYHLQQVKHTAPINSNERRRKNKHELLSASSTNISNDASSISVSSQRNSTGSTRSTGDSSGFLSCEGSTNGTQDSFGTPNRNTRHSNLSSNGGQFANDLERLMLQVNCSSPADSYISCVDLSSISASSMCHNYSKRNNYCADSTLVRARELENTMQCRDEFSSFIGSPDLPNNQEKLGMAKVKLFKPVASSAGDKRYLPSKSSTNKQRVKGPVLVGVHTNLGISEANGRESTRGLERSFPQVTLPNSGESSDEYEGYERPSSNRPITSIKSDDSLTDCLSSSNECASLQDKELVLLGSDNDDTQSSTDKLTASCHNSSTEAEALSRMLKIHLKRVDTLVRLAAGDKEVSMDEAFGSCNDEKICDQTNSHEWTNIEFSPLSEPTNKSHKLLHELEICNFEVDESKTVLIERRQLQGWPLPASELLLANIELNWPLEDDKAHLKKMNLELSNLSEPVKRMKFERQVAKELQTKLSSKEQLARRPSEQNESHISSSVRRQISEFVDDYINFQLELRKHTSYTSDWHQNWLFASKRPNQWENSEEKNTDEILHQNNSPKRARFNSFPAKVSSEETDCDISSSSHASNDLLKYSTLILNRSKPIKVTFATTIATEESKKYLQTENNILKEVKLEIDRSYQAQQEPLEELYEQAVESIKLPDVCCLLLNADSNDHLENDDDDNVMRKNVMKKGQPNEMSILISYYSKLATCTPDPTRFRFTAYGYLFESKLRLPAISQRNCKRRLKTTKSIENNEICAKTTKLREQILNKLANLLSSTNISPFSGPSNIPSSLSEYQVRFKVALSSAELINRPPVVQFCAKISGALPIGVRWFRNSSEELSDLSLVLGADSQRRKAPHEAGVLRIRKPNTYAIDPQASDATESSKQSLLGNSWPIYMHAVHDYEYQSSWSSWFRFKREQDDILFEIRNAQADKDYGVTYRCLLENYCSKTECSFTLSNRPHPGEQATSLNGRTSKASTKSSTVVDVNNNGSDRGNQANTVGGIERKLKSTRMQVTSDSADQDNSRAILRTWSQRTLKKSAPDTSLLPNCEESGHLMDESEESCSLSSRRTSSWQQTVGRRSSFVPVDEDKFGKDFPYHPENLLKRLEENKFSLLKQRIATATTTCNINNRRTALHQDSTTTDAITNSSDWIQFTQSNSKSDQEKLINYSDYTECKVEGVKQEKEATDEAQKKRRMESIDAKSVYFASELKEQPKSTPIQTEATVPKPKMRTRVTAGVVNSAPITSQDHSKERENFSPSRSNELTHHQQKEQQQEHYHKSPPAETRTKQWPCTDGDCIRSRKEKQDQAATCSADLIEGKEEGPVRIRRSKEKLPWPPEIKDANNAAISAKTTTTDSEATIDARHKLDVKSLISRFSLA